MSLRFALSCLLIAALPLAACGGDDDDDDGSGGTAGTAGTGGGGTGGTGATEGGAGDSGACKSCAQMVATAESDLTKACAGNSSTLIQAFVTCTCQPTVCGGAGQGCEAACNGTGQVDQACLTCDATAAAGPCKTEMEACQADQ